MRLWSLHPRYLDRAGLVAAWREALLAQRVLQGGTRGYRNHPQLIRFRRHPDPMLAIGTYLHGLADEASLRGYRFDAAKILVAGDCAPIPCTDGQLEYELKHLAAKLQRRDQARYELLRTVELPQAHPLFRVGPGVREEWEVV